MLASPAGKIGQTAGVLIFPPVAISIVTFDLMARCGGTPEEADGKVSRAMG
jgi:hypothetical protein